MRASSTTRYIFFMRPSLAKHVHLYAAWIKAVCRRGVPVTMLVVLPVTTWLRQRRLVKRCLRELPMTVLVGGTGRTCRWVAAGYFIWQLLWHRKVVVHLKKQDPRMFDRLRRLFRGRLRYIVELEGDMLSEAQYLREHPFKPGTYDAFIRNAARQEDGMPVVLQNTDALFVVSQGLADILQERYPHVDIRGKTTVVPTGVDCAVRHYSPQLRADMRRQLGLENRFIVIYIGNAFYSWQNVNRTIQIFQLLKRDVLPNAFLTLLVNGGDHDTVREFIGKAALEPGDYLLREVPPGEVTGYLNAADLGVLLRHRHVMNRACAPGKFGDYVACGLPVLMTEGIGTFSESVTAARCGVVLSDMDDDDEIVENVARVWPFQDGQRAEIAKWARETLSSEALIDRYLKAVAKL